MDAMLVVNAGSSSVKFQIFAVEQAPGLRLLIKGQLDGIGTRPRLSARASDKSSLVARTYASNEIADVPAAIAAVASWLRQTQRLNLVAAGHRVVHGGPTYDGPVAIDQAVVADLEKYVSLAPLHQPNNLAPIRTLLNSHPDLLQVACFDTAFHHGHSAVADHYAIPERFYVEGVKRYGFHGLSYEYIARRLREVAPTMAAGRVIVAHLGSGASMCALANGRSVASTMGFTALDGIPMGTRPGQIDPGVLLYLLNEKDMTAKAVEDLLYHDCGLKGLSGISNDMRELQSHPDPRARLAVDHFVYRIGLNAAGRRSGRPGRLRVHRRHRREFGDHPCRYREDARMARRRSRPGGECGREVANFPAGEPGCAPRRSHRRGADDCATHSRAASATTPGEKNRRSTCKLTRSPPNR
jgi:acetate kinase